MSLAGRGRQLRPKVANGRWSIRAGSLVIRMHSTAIATVVQPLTTNVGWAHCLAYAQGMLL